MITPSETEHNQKSYDRLINFSDAVIAIAVTLLAIDIRIPRIEDTALLGPAVLNLLPQIAIFALSFIVVASFWYSHHRLFRLIDRYDDRLLWLNIIFLMGVAFLPVPAAALGEHGPEQPIVLFFAVCYIFISLAEYALWHHASRRHRLIDPDIPAHSIRYISLRLLIPSLIFTLSAAIALFNPLLAMLSWLLNFAAFMLLERWHRHHIPFTAA